MDTHPKKSKKIGGFGFRVKKAGIRALGSEFPSINSVAEKVQEEAQKAVEEKEQVEASVAESVGSNDGPTTKRHQKMSNNQGRNNEKVLWTRQNEAQFIVLCHQECLDGNMLLTNFTATVYNKICDKLNALMAGHYVYTAKQCKTNLRTSK